MNNEMTVQEKRQYKRNEFKRKFGQYWLIYIALFGTGTLSSLSGLFLPFRPDAQGVVNITFWLALSSVYYIIGFLSTGEGAGYFWFDKLTDHDKDNTIQQWIAGIMLFVAIVTILITSLAGGAFIAYWLGALPQFQLLPTWAQKWVVWAIPALWVAHAVAGMAFKALSDEAEAERDAQGIIRDAQQKILRDKANAKAEFWKTKAPDVARQIGEMEAQDEIDNFAIKLTARNRNQPPRNNQQPVYQQTTPYHDFSDNGNHEPDPTRAEK